MIKKKWAVIFLLLICRPGYSQQMLMDKLSTASFALVQPGAKTCSCTDSNDFETVQKVAALLADDIFLVTGRRPEIVHAMPATAQAVIITGTGKKSSLIQKLAPSGKLNTKKIDNQWEAPLNATPLSQSNIIWV